MSIQVNEKGICPHCKTPNRFEGVFTNRGTLIIPQYLIHGHLDAVTELRMCRCTECGNIIMFFDGDMIYPLGATRPPCPAEVPENIAEDYEEASLVESYSKKTSAALARRCLQNILHERGITKSNLNEEIEEAMHQLPTYLSEAIDAIRNVGNFAAHPMKYKQTGEVVAVESGETEWILDVIEQLFDFYYVAPKKLKERRESLNEKLRQAGKPELK